jgi:DNA-directed RNA polymerase subunit RPC12/RpoP
MIEVIRFRCPGCGSELETPEGTVSNRCSFCNLVSLLGRPGRIVKRYYQPTIDPREARFVAERHLKQEGRQLFSSIDMQELYYVPFYRFRGLSLTCMASMKTALSGVGFEPDLKTKNYELRARNLDVTVAAGSENPFGMTSLGVRPQTLPTYAYRDEDIPQEAQVLPADLSAAESQERAFRMNSANMTHAHGDKTCEFAEMVGEHQSLIYFPMYVLLGSVGNQALTVVVDGVSKRVVRETREQWFEPRRGKCAAGITELRPEPHHCPNCGADFEPSERSLAYHCKNCDRSWMLEPAGYKQLPPPMVGEGPGELYPFWRAPLVFDRHPGYDTVGKYCKLLTADIPLLDKRKRGLPFFVYVPAFAGADAEWQVQAAVRTTRTQPLLEPVSREPHAAPPVSLAESEGREFAGFAWDWLRMGYLNLRGPDFTFKAGSLGPSELVWLPLMDARLKRSVTRAQPEPRQVRRRVSNS